jgi:hypothetical protein
MGGEGEVLEEEAPRISSRKPLKTTIPALPVPKPYENPLDVSGFSTSRRLYGGPTNVASPS